MSVKYTESNDVMQISGKLHISEASDLRSLLAEGLERKPLLAIDLGGVEACDTAALQLLFAACRSAQTSGRSFRITDASKAVEETCTELGLPLAELSYDAGDIARSASSSADGGQNGR